MLTRRGELLAEHELEAEEKERKLEEQIRQFNAVQAAPGPRQWRPPERPSKISKQNTAPGPVHCRVGRRGKHETGATRDEPHPSVGAASVDL